ncbi:BrnT family toxin [Blastomonas fulva]|uniref:BrnT family toxin n=1 Tax=Blastomonas fulva TaxID=1550728 RepID=A0ABM6M495_9SPHN|nr:BrnT family toxin [Blastomonas fulva]ASR50744.1 hypothetical protein B5J99_04025 [Blastomonas fulva]MDM7967546.1 BrnT family toxin [Blastomonas fulva]
MEITCDPAKDRLNVAQHGLSFEDFAGFDTDPEIRVDDRFDYGEIRYRAFGRIDGQGHCIVFTQTDDGFRLISFRRAHEKEMRRYEQA